MAKDIKFIKDAYLNNHSFFLKFLLNYKEKYGLIDKTLEEKIHLLEKKRSNTRLLDEIADILRKYVKQQKIRVVDMTLREWDQAPWGWLNRFEKAILALYLKEAWVNVIELWFAANPADYHNINYILNNFWDWANDKDPYLSILCRAHVGDVSKAIELLKRYNKPRIHIFYATSEKHMEVKVWEKAKQQGLGKEQYIIKNFLIAIDSALELKKNKPKFELEISFEDAWNTQKEKLLEFAKIMIDRAREENTKIIINLPSTLWDKTAEEMYEIFIYVHRWLLEYYKDYLNWELSAHNHNDNAEALSSSIACVRWWAKNIETSLLGVWEWAWNTPTHIFINKIIEDWRKLWLDFLETYQIQNIKINLIWAVSRLFRRMYFLDLYQLTPYIWEYVHKNSSWVHIRNSEVYRTEDSVEKYWWEKPKNFFSARGSIAQVSQMLKNFGVNFEDESDSFKKIFILKIQREAEKVKTLYPAVMYAIYQQLKWNFKVEKIFVRGKVLILRVDIFDQKVELVWQMEKKNWEIDWIVNALNDFLWKNAKFTLLKTPEKKTINSLRKIVNDLRYSWSYLKIPQIDKRIDKIIKEAEIFELIQDFYYKVEMYYLLLSEAKALNFNTDEKNKEIDFLQSFLGINVMNTNQIVAYIRKVKKLKDSLDEIIYGKNLTKKMFENILSKNREIIKKYHWWVLYQESKNNIFRYLDSRENSNVIWGQDHVVYIECELNKKIINAHAVSKSLMQATVESVIYASLKFIEDRILSKKN